MIYLHATVFFVGLLFSITVFLLIAERFLVNYGIVKVDINSGNKILEVEGGQHLLTALVSQKIYIPSACGGHGSCGFCKVEVKGGGGPVLPTEKPYVTRQELAKGIRLACQVKIRNDMQITIPEDLLNVKLFNAVVESTKYLTHDIKELRFRLQEPDQIDQRPGQYIQVFVPGAGEQIFRAYSISSPSYDKGIVELNVRLIPKGLGSTYLHSLKANDPITFTGPYGEFHLNEDQDTEIICVGGGCGMAPIKNIVYSMYKKWPNRTCYLFFGCRSTRDVFYLEELNAFAKDHPNLKVIYSLSDPVKAEEKWDGDKGFIHLSADKLLAPNVKRQAFLCGPPPMIEAVTVVLKEKGLKSEDIFYDKF